jgi:hypothetical protein
MEQKGIWVVPTICRHLFIPIKEKLSTAWQHKNAYISISNIS